MRPDADTDGGGRNALIRVLAAAALAGVVLAAFLPALSNGFVFDDEQNIVTNPNFRGLQPANLRWMFTTLHMGHYQPLSWVTFGVDYHLWGLNPYGYHLSNLVLHCANTILVFFLAIAVIRAARPASSAAPRRARSDYAAAWFAAALFGVHPLRVESVAWVTERRDVLNAFFLLLTVLAYLRAQDVGPAGRRRWLVAAFGLYVLALLSKVTGVTLVAVLLALDWYPLRRIGRAAGGWFGRVRGVWLEKLPFLAVALAAASLAPLAQAQTNSLASLAEHGLIERCFQACYGLFFYLWKSVVPTNLVPLYELRMPLEWRQPKYGLAAAFVAVAIAVVWRLRRAAPALVTASVAYVALLLPVLGFVQNGPQEVADRYSYLSIMGWIIAAAAGLAMVLRNASVPRFARVAAGLAGTIVIALLVSGTRDQCRPWKNVATLWSHALNQGNPSAIVNYNMAKVHSGLGNTQSAVAAYRRAIKLRPTFAEAHANLGVMLLANGRQADAIQCLENAHRHKPSDANILGRLGNALTASGRIDEGLSRLNDAVRLSPDSASLRYDFGCALAQQGRLDEAIEQFRAALRANPSFAEASNNLANVLARQDRTDEAIAEWQTTVRLRPDHAVARYNLGAMLVKSGRSQEAIEHLQAAVRGRRAPAAAHRYLGRALADIGRVDEAIAELQETLRLDPADADARSRLNDLQIRRDKSP